MIKNVNWEQVNNAISSLDGYNVTYIQLDIEGIGSLVAGGGNFIEEKGSRQYVVTFFDLDKDCTNLLNFQGSSGELYSLVVDNSDGDYPDNFVVGLEKVMSAFKCFYETGRLSDKLEWE